MKKGIKGIIVLLLMSVFLLIRYFESSLFYDPLLAFFKTDHTTAPLPEVSFWKLILFTGVRFLLNSLLSLLILWTVFRSVSVLHFSAILYGIAFLVLLMLFAFLLQTSEAGNHLALFYVRRFLIQPLLLLLLLPAFYAHRIVAKF